MPSSDIKETNLIRIMAFFFRALIGFLQLKSTSGGEPLLGSFRVAWSHSLSMSADMPAESRRGRKYARLIMSRPCARNTHD